MSPKGLARLAMYFALGVAIVFISLQLSFTFYFNDRIKTELQDEIKKQSDNEYELKIEKLGTNIFNQSIFIKGFTLKPVRTVKSNETKYYASAEEINLIDFRLFSFLIKKDLIVARMELLHPSGNVYRSISQYSDQNETAVKHFSIYQLLSKHIHSLTIKNILITNSVIKVFDSLKDSLPSISSTENELTIKNFTINKTADETKRWFLAAKVKLVINDFSYITKDSLYVLAIKKLTASYNDSTIILDSLKLVPNYTKNKFATEAGKQTDRLKMEALQIEFDKMDVKLFFERNWFIAEQLKVSHLNFSAYRDKNDVRKETVVKSVQQLVRSIPFYTAIQVIHLSNSFVAYEEVALGSAHPGKITFNNLKATITGFTNDTLLYKKQSALNVNATASLMNKGKIKAHYRFPLNTTEMVFDCEGKLSELAIASLNPMLEPNASVRIKSGVIDSMIFSFHANEKEAKGKMKLIYHHLNLELLSKQNKKSNWRQDVLSFLAQRLIIKEDNPTKNGEIRLSEIYYPRNPNRFIFNYSWKSILSGIKPVIGLPEKKGKN